MNVAPFAGPVIVSVGAWFGAGATVSNSDRWSDALPASVTRTSSGNAPACAGVPDRRPPADSDIPPGSTPSESSHA